MENEVIGSYQPMLVALSYLVAVAASLSALDLTGRLHKLGREARALGSFVAAVALGFGMWGTHLVGMIVQILRDAVEQGDQERIRFAAHALKSASGNIRADRLTEQLFQLEMAGKIADVKRAARLLGPAIQEAEAVTVYLNGSADS